MRCFRLLVAYIVFVGVASAVSAQGERQNFVGTNSCASDVQAQGASFGMRLDKSQRAFLEYRNLGNIKVLFIIQYKNEGDKCGVIRDAVETPDLSQDFEFSCIDRAKPTDVVVGTSRRTDSRDTITAHEAWRIDLKKQSFNTVPRKVTCYNESYAGEDDGSDLVDAAKTRATHRNH